jgi:hypothetical protein
MSAPTITTWPGCEVFSCHGKQSRGRIHVSHLMRLAGSGVPPNDLIPHRVIAGETVGVRKPQPIGTDRLCRRAIGAVGHEISVV